MLLAPIQTNLQEQFVTMKVHASAVIASLAIIISNALAGRAVAEEPIAAPTLATAETAAPLEVPADVRDHTYFVVVNGIDPIYFGKLNCYCDRIRDAGYKNVYLYSLRQCGAAERQARCIRESDPKAKLVLVGYSVGCQCVRKICNTMACNDQFVDLLVYLAGDYLCDDEKTRPKNAGRIVNINGHGFKGTGGDLFYNGAEISGATNYRLNARHFWMPKQAAASDILLQAVAEMNAEPKAVEKK